MAPLRPSRSRDEGKGECEVTNTPLGVFTLYVSGTLHCDATETEQRLPHFIWLISFGFSMLTLGVILLELDNENSS